MHHWILRILRQNQLLGTYVVNNCEIGLTFLQVTVSYSKMLYRIHLGNLTVNFVSIKSYIFFILLAIYIYFCADSGNDDSHVIIIIAWIC